MASDSNFVRFFGKSPFVQIVDAFIDNVGSDYSKKEIQELAGISKGSLFNSWKQVEELGIVKVTRRYGKTKLYALNTDSLIVKDIMRWEMDMIDLKMPEKQRQKIAAVQR
ncbi:Uncharacterised protein [uncultured archaeon]|nr:Uncharacterised protein [uncultured archaeon]